MARRTIATRGGNWSDPNTWLEGEVPTYQDDIYWYWQSGELTIDINNAMCNSVEFKDYQGNLTFMPGSNITIIRGGTISAGMILVNPVGKIAFYNSLLNVSYDEERMIAMFNDGATEHLVSYI